MASSHYVRGRLHPDWENTALAWADLVSADILRTAKRLVDDNTPEEEDRKAVQNRYDALFAMVTGVTVHGLPYPPPYETGVPIEDCPPSTSSKSCSSLSEKDTLLMHTPKPCSIDRLDDMCQSMSKVVFEEGPP